MTQRKDLIDDSVFPIDNENLIKFNSGENEALERTIYNDDDEYNRILESKAAKESQYVGCRNFDEPLSRLPLSGRQYIVIDLPEQWTEQMRL
jgi:hypothetical protein